MITQSDFDLRRIRASAFVDSESFQPSAALRYVLGDWGDVYDGETTSIPLSSDVPPELPTVLLASKDRAWRVEMSRSRVDLFWLKENGDAVNLADTLSEFSIRLATICEKAGTHVGRLAAIVHRRAEISEPGKTVARQFCRDEWLAAPLNRPEGFELHAHKTFDLMSTLKVNSWFRIRTAKGNFAEYRYVTVEQDLNTLAQGMEERRFGSQEMAAMFAAAPEALDATLGMYFPDRS